MLASYRRRRMDVWLAELAEHEVKAAASDADAEYLQGLHDLLIGSACAGLRPLATVDVLTRAMDDFRG